MSSPAYALPRTRGRAVRLLAVVAVVLVVVASWLTTRISAVENPSVLGTLVSPAAGTAYLDRENVRPGMIVDHDAVTTAFAAEGFTWGGHHSVPTDYQRFEAPAQ
jgi:hypothetical protein